MKDTKYEIGTIDCPIVAFNELTMGKYKLRILLGGARSATALFGDSPRARRRHRRPPGHAAGTVARAARAGGQWAIAPPSISGGAAARRVLAEPKRQAPLAGHEGDLPLGDRPVRISRARTAALDRRLASSERAAPDGTTGRDRAARTPGCRAAGTGIGGRHCFRSSSPTSRRWRARTGDSCGRARIPQSAAATVTWLAEAASRESWETARRRPSSPLRRPSRQSRRERPSPGRWRNPTSGRKPSAGWRSVPSSAPGRFYSPGAQKKLRVLSVSAVRFFGAT